MKLGLLLVAVVVIFAGCIKGRKSPKETSEYVEMFKSGNVIGIDVRTVRERKINGAGSSLHIPLAEINSSSQLDEIKGKKLFVFCESGSRSSQALRILKSRGFDDVTNIGDWRTWNSIESQATKTQ